MNKCTLFSAITIRVPKEVTDADAYMQKQQFGPNVMVRIF